jgi:hypothetical protein
MSIPSAGDSLSTRSKIRTPGPQMANMTIDGYQPPRTLHRVKTGSKYFGGPVTDYSMRIDEFEVVLAFRNNLGSFDVNPYDQYPGHLGTESFSVLNGIEHSMYWLYNNTRVVGVSKSHTKLDDRRNGTYSQLAIHVGGTTSLMLNGRYSIIDGTEVIVRFYDRVNAPDMYDSIFHKTQFLDAGEERIVAVLEPYTRYDNILDQIKYNHPLLNGKEDVWAGIDMEREAYAKRNTMQGIVERLHKSNLNLMLFGYMILRSFEEVIENEGNINRAFPLDLSKMQNMIDSTFLMNDTVAKSIMLNIMNEIIDTDDAFYDESKEFHTVLAKLLYSLAKGDQMNYQDESNDLLSKAWEVQKGARNAVIHQREIIMFERNFIIGTATETATQGNRLNVKLHRG